MNDLNEWLRLARQGDDEAYGKLVETCQTPVFNLCYRMLNDPMEAEDAAQETFWRAYQALHRYDPNRPFLTWLLSIAAHFCIDQQRRRKLPIVDIELLSEDGVPDGNTPSPEKVSRMNEEQRLLHGLIAGLGPQDRAAIVLRYWYDFSEEEIAQSLNLTVSAVKSRLHRARLALAQRWPAQAQDEGTDCSISEGERRKHASPAF